MTPSSASSSGAFVQVLEREKSCLKGETFGSSSYVLYEAFSLNQQHEPPYLLLWLHGADGGALIPQGNLRSMQGHLRRRTFFLVPICPAATADGRRFTWGVSATKAQNRNGLGFVFGELHEEYLGALCGLVQRCATDHGAERVIVSGYSMGGFGAVQLGGWAPELFDAVVPVAGYGLGTTEPPSKSCGAPQPESSQIFQAFLDQYVCRMACVAAVIVIHAETDDTSSFRDAQLMVETIQNYGGSAELVIVPEHATNSDPKRRRRGNYGHNYFNYALLDDTSEDMLYSRLRAAFGEEASASFAPQPTPCGIASFAPQPTPCGIEEREQPPLAEQQLWQTCSSLQDTARLGGITVRGSIARAVKRSASAVWQEPAG